MNLREAEIVKIKVKVAEVVVGFRVARIMFQRRGETIKSFGRVSFSGLNDAEIAVGIGNTNLLLDRAGIKLSRPEIAAFIEHERLLEITQPGIKIQNLRRGLGEERQLIGIRDVALFDAFVTELGGLGGKFEDLHHFVQKK